MLEPLKLLLSILLSYLTYDNQDLISDDNTHALLMALCSVVVIFTLSGSWNYLTDGREIRISSRFSIRNYHLTYTALSFFFAYQVFENYSPYMYDDSAFTLRYLDNFHDGYFYHYNKTDPPVFGISSFSYGIFTGFWCWLHILTPEQSIHLAGFTGLLLVSFLVLKILRELVTDNRLILILWLAIIFSSKMFLNVAKSGMESAFHISILFTALLFFIQNKSKWMWLFLALSVISKLDSVPLVVVTGLCYLLINRQKILPLSTKNKFISELFLYAVLPLVAWIFFAFFVFGSPLPQSAYSKIFLHYHPDDYWFPFFKYYLSGGKIELVLKLFFVLFFTHLIFASINNKKYSFKNLVFGISFFATMVLYYFYNPGEQMTWYYVLPDLLLLLQIAVSFWFFLSFISQKVIRTILASVSIFYFIGWTGMDVIGGKYWMEAYLETVERERLEMGKYVGTMVGEKDSIMSNHGLVVRYVKGYVVDMSGLNSKFAASFKIDPELLFKKHHPQWAINHNSLPYATLLSANGYAPVRLFYDITNYAYPQWCFYKKLPLGSAKVSFAPLDSAKIINTKPLYNGGIILYQNDTIRLQTDSIQSIKQITFGIRRRSLPFALEIKKLKNKRLLTTETIEITPVDDYPMDSKFTKSIVINSDSLSTFNRVEITTKTRGLLFTIIEPYIYKQNNY